MPSNFPKMGEEPLTGSLVNVSGNRSPYTKTVPRKGPSADVLAEGGTANRSPISMDGEHNGPRFAPVTTLPFKPTPETGRGLRTVPSSVGNRDFWDRRNSDGGGQVIS